MQCILALVLSLILAMIWPLAILSQDAFVLMITTLATAMASCAILTVE